MDILRYSPWSAGTLYNFCSSKIFQWHSGYDSKLISHRVQKKSLLWLPIVRGGIRLWRRCQDSTFGASPSKIRKLPGNVLIRGCCCPLATSAILALVTCLRSSDQLRGNKRPNLHASEFRSVYQMNSCKLFILTMLLYNAYNFLRSILFQRHSKVENLMQSIPVASALTELVVARN